MQKEPAVLISTVAAFFTAVLGCAAAFGFNLSGEQQKAVLAVVASASSLILVLGPIIRTFVWSPASVQKKVSTAETQGAKGETVAPVAP